MFSMYAKIHINSCIVQKCRDDFLCPRDKWPAICRQLAGKFKRPSDFRFSGFTNMYM